MNRKMQATLAATATILILGYLVSLAPRGQVQVPDWFAPDPPVATPAARAPAGTLRPAPTLTADPALAPAEHIREAREAELVERFNQGALMLHAREYDYAIKALHRVLELAPRLPEAHVNMGFALLGLERYAAAADFFQSAIELNAFQANAYYGLATALDELGDREAALGAMRSFVHLAGEADEAYLVRARSALWEWQAALERERAALPDASGDDAP